MNHTQELEHLRHSLAHLLAASVLKLYPNTKNAIGPAIKDGFYYDFSFSKPPSEKDLTKIEREMRVLLPSWKEFTHEEVRADIARKHFHNNPYKLEIIDDLEKEGEKITLYTSGEFTDLCRGGHLNNPAKEIAPDAFTLTKTAGAYWRGSEKNDMLTRIYGVAFATKKELDAHLTMQQEAEKRDHRKLGRELDLFIFSDLVGAGLPLFTPKGTILRAELQKALLVASKKYDMQPVTIPHIARRKLYELSGHAQKFGDELLTVSGHYDTFVLKPVNCPHHTQIYASAQRSYRDLPIRYMESTMQYRDEKPGEIGGLVRTRGFTVDDGHIFCTLDQTADEVKKIAQTIKDFYTGLGLYDHHWVSLSLRDPKTPEAYVGEPHDWDQAEHMLQTISDQMSLDAKRMEGEAALYGPKLDYMFKDSLGREHQLATIQLDFAMPKRFELTYTDKDGSKKTPIMIHRAILGSYERFLAILIEHFAGAFPLWLSPLQVATIPVSEKFNRYGEKVVLALKENGVRAELHNSNETLGKRIRTVEKQKIPYILVVGEKEESTDTVAVRSRDRGDEGVLQVETFIQKIIKEIEEKK